MKLFCLDKNLETSSAHVDCCIKNETRLNDEVVKYTVSFENKGGECEVIPVAQIEREGVLNYYMIPCMIYNGNEFGNVIEPKTMRYEGKPWIFSSDRVGLAGCSISETTDKSVAFFSKNNGNECSCSVFDDGEKTVHRIYFSHIEYPVRYSKKSVFSDPIINTVLLKKDEKVEYVCYKYEYNKTKDYYGFNKLFDFANTSYATIRKPRYKTQDLKEWNKDIQIKLKEDKDFGVLFNIGFLPDGEHKTGSDTCEWKWRKGTKYEAGWCGQNLSIAELFLRYYKETNDEFFKDTAIKVLDTWFLRQHDNGLVSALYDREFCDSEKIDTCNEGWIVHETLACCSILKELGVNVEKYENGVKRICEFFVNNTNGGFPQILNGDGSVAVKDGAAGAMLVYAFTTAYEYFGDERYLARCKQAFEHYWNSYLKFAVSPGGALDTYCVDKESCHPFVSATIKLYKLTKDTDYLSKAEDLAHYLMSWAFYHDIEFDKDSDCAKIGLKTTGATSVSASHHHLDAYGAVYVADMLELFALTGNKAYENHAKILWNFVVEYVSDGSLTLHGMQRWKGMQNEGVFNCSWGMANSKNKGELNDWMVAWIKAYQQKTIYYMLENNICFD